MQNCKNSKIEHYKYLGRLESAVDGYFQGYVLSEDKFEPLDESQIL
jgi:hypothetical protein